MNQSLYMVAPCIQISFVGTHILPNQPKNFSSEQEENYHVDTMGRNVNFETRPSLPHNFFSHFKRMLKKIHCSLQITRHKSLCDPIASLQN